MIIKGFGSQFLEVLSGSNERPYIKEKITFGNIALLRLL
jgi:hypothetical protein